jgi:FkbM family methyltransferase
LTFADTTESYERTIITHLITQGNVVFDVGANVGSWARRVLVAHKDIELHAFEPMPHIIQALTDRLKAFAIYKQKVIINQLGLSDKTAHGVPFLCLMTDNWADNMGSTFNPEWFTPGRLDNYNPVWIKVNTATTDDYCKAKNIHYIDFMKIDVEGHQFSVLKGATGLLSIRAVKIIQWESGGKAAMEEALWLSQFGYQTGMFKVNPLRVEPINPEVEFYNYLAWIGELPYGLSIKS